MIHLIISFAPPLVPLLTFFFFSCCFSGDLRKVIRPVNTSRNYQLPHGRQGEEGFNHVFTDGPCSPVRWRFYRYPPGGGGKHNTPRKYRITNGRRRTVAATVPVNSAECRSEGERYRRNDRTERLGSVGLCGPLRPNRKVRGYGRNLTKNKTGRFRV